MFQVRVLSSKRKHHLVVDFLGQRQLGVRKLGKRGCLTLMMSPSIFKDTSDLTKSTTLGLGISFFWGAKGEVGLSSRNISLAESSIYMEASRNPAM